MTSKTNYQSYSELVIEPSENTKMSKNGFRQYSVWFLLGFMWGLVAQLAMVGCTTLAMKFQIPLDAWFGRSIIIVFSAVNVGAPLVICNLMTHVLNVVTTDIEEDLDDVIDSYDIYSRLFAVFFILGSMLGILLVCTVLSVLYGTLSLSIEGCFLALFFVTFACAVKLFHLSSPLQPLLDIEVNTRLPSEASVALVHPGSV